MKTCAICGMDVNENTYLKDNVEGTTYYFCSGMCQTKFRKEKGL